MKIQRAHKIQLCPNNKQANYFAQACGAARFTYNWALTEWKRQYEAGEKLSPYKLKKEFNAIKRVNFPWILKVTKCAPEQAFNDLGAAFQNFFRNVKNGKKPGYPKYKKRGARDSFYIANDRIKFDGKKVRVPKLGWVKTRETLRFEGEILSATVSKIAGKWFVAVQVEQKIQDLKPTGPVIGIDVGIKSLAVVSDGRVFENPRTLQKQEARLRMFQKAVSRKKKGSNNRKKAILKLQRQHHRITCIRKDSLHKLTSAITKGVSVIGIEDLHVKGMVKNRRLSKTLSDASLGELHRQLEYKAQWHRVDVVKADKFYPSSKTCSKCGSVKTDLALSDRVYRCDCGFEMDRDLNAAINLKNLAVGSTVTACCLGSSGFPFGGSETTDWAGISRKSA